VSNLVTVLTVSHSGSCDGPNLAYGADLPPEKKQPWGSVACRDLSAAGTAFWQAVARVTQRRVFASPGVFGAGDPTVVLKHVKAIEKDLALEGMQEFEGP
jgi:hypothetical protein